jgi:MurNAc alpha-1-phosphate uridylyltransferase
MNLPALILAAGRGERMRPLTDHTPKPLLLVRGRPLVCWHLQALAEAGVQEVVINTAWLEEQFEPALGSGAAFGLRIRYSHEGRDSGGALETAGGIAKALSLLGKRFWVVSGDVFLPGFEFAAADASAFAASGRLAQLWLTGNAPHHPHGDFGITAEGLARSDGPDRLTWASVGLFSAELFAGIAPGTRMALRPLLDQGITARRIGAQRLLTPWTDVGTPERLAQLNQPGLR